MEDIREIDFPEKDLPLRHDVSLLGQMVGEALVEQHGPGLLEDVETVRKAAILRREGDDASAAVLEQTLTAFDINEVVHVTKAFSTYLRLANLAETLHRIRRRRDYLKVGKSAQRGSLEQVFSSLANTGVSAEGLEQALLSLRIQPVFTAHPTEATRRSFLEKEYSIIHRLVERFNPDRTPQEEQQTLDRIRDAIQSAWQTNTVPSIKPKVADELENVLFYLTEILYRVIPPFQQSLQEAFRKAYGRELSPALSREVLRFGSWVGGDMDGNPNVTAQTILETLLTQRNAIIRCYQPELNRLGRYLSQTHGQARFDKQVLQRWLEYSELMPEVTETIPARHHEMPYRCLLKCISARLEGTRTGGQHAYPDVETFLGDIKLIAQSLENNKGAHAGLFGIRRLLQRIETFGFHLATLDARQDALLHREVMGELLNLDDWVETDTESRQQTLTGFLERVSPGIERTTEERVSLSVAARDTLAVFSSIRQARGLYGTQATGLFIISMTQGADDVLTALALARTAGLVEAVGGDQGVPLDIAPLLETVGDLEAGPKILDTLLESGYYRKHLEQRGNRQVIMIGYSDSNKDSGIASARWSLFEAQARLVEIGHQNGVSIQFFHGRGGTVSRGGGNLVKGIEGAPAGSVNGYLRVTEQGEVINQKYGVRPIALRNLELVTGATLRHGLGDTGQHADEGMCAIMNGIAANARSQYRKLVFETPAFIRFFRSATPIDVIERLAIGSRPASRRSGEGIENLRAIPWVFSWAQIRVGFPGVYGIGGALQRAIDQHGIESLRAMLKHWSFFQGLVNDVEMVLAKSELDIGRRYVELAMPETRVVFEQVMAEFDLARHHILEIKQSRELLADQRTLQRNIRLRNPYADPMHILQINLLHRWREGGREDDTLLHALKSTVNGIALAIQNTG